jgi:hypothetical protein
MPWLYPGPITQADKFTHTTTSIIEEEYTMARSKNKQKRKSLKFKLKRTKREERKKRLQKSALSMKK